MHKVDRTFQESPQGREPVPLLVGIVGSSASGKTYSALRLATGMQSVIGGDIWVIDTEHKRAKFYDKYFRFRHLPMAPPHGSLDYLAAIQYCMSKGGQIIVVDSMTHEHSGEGGYMDLSEKFLDRKCGDDERCRHKNFSLSLVDPASRRKKMIRGIVQLGINGIFCFRGHEKLKFAQGKEPENIGLQAETTSPLKYEMAVQFHLPTYSNGVPNWSPESRHEKDAVKLPRQFQEWDCFKPGVQLSEDIGARLARWAANIEDNPKPTRSHAELVATALAHFESKGVSLDRVLAKLAVESVDRIDDSDLAVMRDLAGKLGSQSADDLFPKVESREPGSGDA